MTYQSCNHTGAVSDRSPRRGARTTPSTPSQMVAAQWAAMRLRLGSVRSGPQAAQLCTRQRLEIALQASLEPASSTGAHPLEASNLAGPSFLVATSQTGCSSESWGSNSSAAGSIVGKHDSSEAVLRARGQGSIFDVPSNGVLTAAPWETSNLEEASFDRDVTDGEAANLARPLPGGTVSDRCLAPVVRSATQSAQSACACREAGPATFRALEMHARNRYQSSGQFAVASAGRSPVDMRLCAFDQQCVLLLFRHAVLYRVSSLPCVPMRSRSAVPRRPAHCHLQLAGCDSPIVRTRVLGSRPKPAGPSAG